MSLPFIYETCCMNISQEDVPALQEMTRGAKSITYDTMRRHCRGFLDWAKQHGYVIHGNDLKLRNDWHVGYYKSSFKGRPCYYVQWSGIEYIWTPRPD